MKKVILTTMVVMLGAAAFAEKKVMPVTHLNAKAYVYKVKEVEKKDGTYEAVSEEICKKDIRIPSYKGTSDDDGTLGGLDASISCSGKILGHDVTVIVGAIHSDLLIRPGKIANEHGLNAWMNTRANMIIGWSYIIAGKAKRTIDPDTNDSYWESNDIEALNNTELKETLPGNHQSSNIYRGSVHQGFSSIVELDNSTLCNRIKDAPLVQKCFDDGFFRAVIVYEGKK